MAPIISRHCLPLRKRNLWFIDRKINFIIFTVISLKICGHSSYRMLTRQVQNFSVSLQTQIFKRTCSLSSCNLHSRSGLLVSLCLEQNNKWHDFSKSYRHKIPVSVIEKYSHLRYLQGIGYRMHLDTKIYGCSSPIVRTLRPRPSNQPWIV